MKNIIITLAVLFVLSLVGCITDDKGNTYIPQGKCGVCDAFGISKPNSDYYISPVDQVSHPANTLFDDSFDKIEKK